MATPVRKLRLFTGLTFRRAGHEKWESGVLTTMNGV